MVWKSAWIGAWVLVNTSYFPKTTAWVSKGERILQKAFPPAPLLPCPTTCMVSSAHVCLTEFPKAGGWRTGRNALGGSRGRWTSSLYFQSKCSRKGNGNTSQNSGRSKTQMTYQTGISFMRWRGTVARGHQGDCSSVNKKGGEVRSSSYLSKEQLGKSRFYKQGITHSNSKLWAVEGYLVKMCSPRFSGNSRMHFNFSSGHMNSGKVRQDEFKFTVTERPPIFLWEDWWCFTWWHLMVMFGTRNLFFCLGGFEKKFF